jgi:hypothetical protein
MTKRPKCIEHRKTFDKDCDICNRELTASKILSTVNGRLLYAITLEKWALHDGRMQWVPNGFVYTHAISVARARYEYEKSPEPGCRIIAIAPVIGYNVHDNHGDKLSV